MSKNGFTDSAKSILDISEYSGYGEVGYTWNRK